MAKIGTKLQRQTYSQLRKAGQQLLTRLTKKYPANYFTQSLPCGRFPKLSELKTESQLAKATQQLQTFGRMPTARIRGYDKGLDAQLARFRALDRGLDPDMKRFNFLNKGNMEEFFRFMEDWRVAVKKAGGGGYDSNQAIEVFKNAQRMKVSNEDVIKNYDWWADNLGKLEKTRKISKRLGSSFSSSDYASRIGVSLYGTGHD